MVANRYPAVAPDVETCSAKHGTNEEQNPSGPGLFGTLSAYGHHEVVIESACHHTDLARMPVTGIGSMIETYHARHLALMGDPRVQTITVFCNHWVAAGATLTHPHSQIIASSLVAPEIERKRIIAARYGEAHGTCLHCDIIERERREGARVIGENGGFIAFVPFAAVTPFEIRIVPKRHQAGFDLIEREERADLAELLKDVLVRLEVTLEDPDYNLMLTSEANRTDSAAGEHWYLSIHPRLITLGGFEIGVGININPSLPKQDAELLRAQR